MPLSCRIKHKHILLLCSPFSFQAFNQKPTLKKKKKKGKLILCFGLNKYIIPAALYSVMQSVLLIWHKNNEDLNKGDDIKLNTIKLEQNVCQPMH